MKVMRVDGMGNPDVSVTESVVMGGLSKAAAEGMARRLNHERTGRAREWYTVETDFRIPQTRPRWDD